MINDELRAAAKRKDLKSILALILMSEGRDDDAKAMKEATRLTASLIDRTMCDREVVEQEPDYSEIKEEYADEPDELTYADEDVIDEEVEGLAKKLSKLQKAIVSGKAKKAKKVLKELIGMGLKGAEIDKLKAQVKEIEKDN